MSCVTRIWTFCRPLMPIRERHVSPPDEDACHPWPLMRVIHGTYMCVPCGWSHLERFQDFRSRRVLIKRDVQCRTSNVKYRGRPPCDRSHMDIFRDFGSRRAVRKKGIQCRISNTEHRLPCGRSQVDRFWDFESRRAVIKRDIQD